MHFYSCLKVHITDQYVSQRSPVITTDGREKAWSVLKQVLRQYIYITPKPTRLLICNTGFFFPEQLYGEIIVMRSSVFIPLSKSQLGVSTNWKPRKYIGRKSPCEDMCSELLTLL
jgi:hypothetical protein